MAKRWVHPEGGEAFPLSKEDEEALAGIGFQPEGKEKQEEKEEKPKRGRPRKE